MFNVCLVEDEKNLNDLIKTYLEKANYKVIQCYSGKEAMEVDEKIHLWILDIMLGDDISGYDIIKHIRETDEKVPIILDEAFAFFDNERLKNILLYLSEEFKNRQIIILTCTNREKEILNNENINYNYVEL